MPRIQLLTASVTLVGLTLAGPLGGGSLPLATPFVSDVALSDAVRSGGARVLLVGDAGSGKSAELAEREGPSGAFLKGIITTAFNTGMRAGEIRALRWSHIDREHGVIRLPADVTKESKAKVIPINHHVKRLLAELRLLLAPGTYQLVEASLRTRTSR